jgi:hypothetical protein
MCHGGSSVRAVNIRSPHAATAVRNQRLSRACRLLLARTSFNDATIGQRSCMPTACRARAIVSIRDGSDVALGVARAEEFAEGRRVMISALCACLRLAPIPSAAYRQLGCP